MIAAIYARKPTAASGMNYEKNFVTRQIEHAKGEERGCSFCTPPVVGIDISIHRWHTLQREGN
jgi:hypothetical protein